MFTIKTSFDSEGFRKKATDAVKETIRKKIRAAGLSRVKVSFDCDSKGFPKKIHLSGPEADVAKAQAVLKAR